MRLAIKAVLALATFVVAHGTEPDEHFDSIFKPSADESVPAGKTYTVQWTPPHDDALNGPVSIILYGGSSAASLLTVKTVASELSPGTLFPRPYADMVQAGVDNKAGKYEWHVDSTLGDKARYGLKIVLESDDDHWQWSPGFRISGSSKADDTTANSTDSQTTTGSSTGTHSHPATITGSTSKTSASVAVQTSTQTIRPNNTIASVAPKPSSTSSSSTGLAAKATAGVAAVVGGLAFAVLGL